MSKLYKHRCQECKYVWESNVEPPVECAMCNSPSVCSEFIMNDASDEQEEPNKPNEQKEQE